MKNNNDSLEKEILEIQNYRFEVLQKIYPSIRNAYTNQYDDPELDPLRDEIFLCLMFGFNQAAITLTNHFMEHLLKYALIANEIRSSLSTKEKLKHGPITSFVLPYKKAAQKYGSKNLETTINVAYAKRVITKDQKEQLLIYKKQFRNSYGHADKDKIFGDASIPVKGLSFGNGVIKDDEEGIPKVADFPVGQGYIQWLKAQSDALPYFLYLDKLAHEIVDILYG